MSLKTALMVMMSSLLTCFAWGETCCKEFTKNCERCHEDCNIINPQCYDRIVVLLKDTTVQPPAVPIDPNHKAMIASKLYRKEDADAMTAAALQDILLKTGYDFSVITPDNQGTRIMPGVGLFVCGVINPDKTVLVAHDSAHKERGEKNNIWYGVEFGNYVLWEPPAGQVGTFPGGLLKGQSYRTNDLYVFAEMNLLQCNSNFEIPCSREVIRLRSYFMSNAFNLQVNPASTAIGYSDNIHAFDSNGNIGIWLGSFIAMYDIFDLENGIITPIYRETAVLSWPVITPPQ